MSVTRETAEFLAALTQNASHPEIAEVYAYTEAAMHPGLGVVFHSSAKIHILLE